MIRKQLYIEPRHEEALKRRARELGVTEAELVRRALDVALTEDPAARHWPSQAQAAERLLAALDRVAATGELGSEAYDRDDRYRERASRLDRRRS